MLLTLTPFGLEEIGPHHFRLCSLSLSLCSLSRQISALQAEGGPEDALLLDPVHEDTYNGLWRMTSLANTAIHCRIFANTPSDSYPTLKDYSRGIEWREGEAICTLC